MITEIAITDVGIKSSTFLVFIYIYKDIYNISHHFYGIELVEIMTNIYSSVAFP